MATTRLRSGWLVVLGALGAVDTAWFAVAAASSAAASGGDVAVSAPFREKKALTNEDLPWAMAQLLAEVPLDAELLVVTDRFAVWPVGMYALPRQVHVLCGFDERSPGGLRRLDPILKYAFARRYDALEAEERRFTRERCLRRLATASHLLVLAPCADPPTAPDVALALLVVIGDPQQPAAALYRIERR